MGLEIFESKRPCPVQIGVAENVLEPFQALYEAVHHDSGIAVKDRGEKRKAQNMVPVNMRNQQMYIQRFLPAH
jgi:hypothetical protein